MIEILMYINAAFMAFAGILVLTGKTPWIKVLSVRILITLIVIEIVLFAVAKNISYAMDVAIVFALLGFIDVKFISVFLRKKGDL